MADIVIVEPKLDPNPVKENGIYTISVRVIDKVHGILTKDGKLIMAKDGKAINRKDG